MEKELMCNLCNTQLEIGDVDELAGTVLLICPHIPSRTGHTRYRMHLSSKTMKKIVKRTETEGIPERV